MYVGIYDDSIAYSLKGNNFPILSLNERVLMVLSNEYVDDVIIGAPLSVSEDLIKTFNISSVVQSNRYFEEMKFYQPAYELGEDPYRVAKEKNIFEILEIESVLSTEVICKRVIENRERQMMRFKKGTQKNEKYYNLQKEYVAEI